MDVGVFIPINNNGWLISETAPQYMPSFDLNKAIALKAEEHGLDFLLSMIKLRGFGGKTEFWEYGLESFTLMAGLAAVTERIKIYATCPTLVEQLDQYVVAPEEGDESVEFAGSPGQAVFDNLNLIPDQTVRRAGEYRLSAESLTVA